MGVRRRKPETDATARGGRFFNAVFFHFCDFFQSRLHETGVVPKFVVDPFVDELLLVGNVALLLVVVSFLVGVPLERRLGVIVKIPTVRGEMMVAKFDDL